MTLKTNLILVFIFVALISYSQENALKFKVQVPVQFGLGYEGKISKHFSFQASAGLLTKPNSTLIIDALDAFGTDPQVTLMIEDAFNLGFVGEGGLNYNFGRNYIGVFFQVINLHGGETPTAIVEDFFDTDVSDYPQRRNRSTTNEKYLKIKSTLVQGGLLYGRRFPLKDKHWEIDAEFGISANLGSETKITSEEYDLTALSKVADAEIGGYYKDYAFVPSLSVALVYKFNKK